MIYYPAFRSIVKQCGNKDDFLAKVKNPVDQNSIIKFVTNQWELFHFIAVMSNDMRSFLELLSKCGETHEAGIYERLSLELYAIKCGKYHPSTQAAEFLKDLKLLQIIDLNKKSKANQIV